MARVSQEHLDARRRQILDGAALCFARNGFHATSMQDVLKEVGLSAGAVYRYFSGKDELIHAIVSEVLGEIRAIFEEAARQTPPPPPDVLVGHAFGQVLGLRPELAQDGRAYFPRLLVQAWTETLRNDELRALIQGGYDGVRAAWVRIVEGYQAAGMMRADVSADRVARTMIAVAQGFAAQVALIDDVPVDALGDGLRGLMSMGEPG
ncbi:TetR/AcrR family transcriptional regulator [Streptomyces aurantiacus]|uniref:Putative HTH-type transcriptional regulator YfiR n=1 Tax=Streptomyces aurantiacus JA 4570 TaxID=1286094 RepID=S3ZSJ3_9ACTN|nr:TetR/AcrR family transcriptional regulator [Streptomyces aurantiacus]EPH46406.1 putative HTH-type transcriptional regulator YfiR [Streptomyces aurantiacus JA 4570]